MLQSMTLMCLITNQTTVSTCILIEYLVISIYIDVCLEYPLYMIRMTYVRFQVQNLQQVHNIVAILAPSGTSKQNKESVLVYIIS